MTTPEMLKRALVLMVFVSASAWSQTPPSTSPSSLRFSSVGTETGGVEKAIRVTNKGAVDLQITLVRREGADREDFSQSNGCGLPLAPKGSCLVTVRFAPETAGTKQATLVLESTAGSVSVPLVGVAAGPRLSMSPRAVKFSKTNVGSESPAKFFTIRNSGKGVLQIQSLQSTGPQGSEFAFSHDCVRALERGASCRGEVRFTPGASGTREGGIEILANEGRFVLGLSGTGYAAEPKLALSPSRKLSFSSQGTEIESAPKRIRVMNRGAAPLRVISLQRSGSDQEAFAQTNTCGGEIDPREECEIAVTFTPQAARDYLAALTIRSNAGDLALELAGKGAGPKLKLSPSRVSFPTTEALTQSAPQEIVLSNTGKGMLRISSLAIEGGHPEDFAVTSQCNTPLAPKEKCTVFVSFAPTSSGSKEATLRLSATNANSLGGALKGKATEAMFTVGGSVGGLAEGESVTLSLASQSVTLTKNGGFSFAKKLPSGSTYKVVLVAPPAEKNCRLDNESGSINNSNVTVSITCRHPSPPSLNETAQAFRFLTRTTFGPTQSDLQALMRLGDTGFSTWIDQQMQVPMSSALAMLSDDAMSSVNDGNRNFQARIDNWFQTAIYGEDQLRQRVAFALSQIMVVSDEGVPLPMSFALSDYHDTLARHAFGNFRDLLEAVTLHPAMGVYLSMIGNRRALPGTSLRPDENYAREVMQLFSIGLVQLNQNGSVRLDSSGQPIPTYDRETISGFARVFTGWNYSCDYLQASNPGCNFETANYDYPSTDTLRTKQPFNQIRPMKMYEQYHEPGDKQLLVYPGVRLPGGKLLGGKGGIKDLEEALDNIFLHPNVGPFIGKQLIQKLVSSNPSPEYVARVSQVFNNDGRGQRGNLAAVIRAILLDEEALDPTFDNPASGKLKEPLIAMLQLWRAFNAQQVNKNAWIQSSFCCPVFGDEPLYVFGQRAMGARSVFNFYSPFYAPPGELARRGLVAPESQIATEGLYGLQSWYYYVTAFYRTHRKAGSQGNDVMYINIEDELPLRGSPDQLLDQVAMKLLGHTNLSRSLREGALRMIRKHDANSEDRVSEAIYFIATSPQYAYQ